MCGIWGIIYKEPQQLNKVLFNSLGVLNDTRGGDSCGIFIDGRTEYGVNDKKYYSRFFSSSKLLKKDRPVSIALGHDRKASVGVINEFTAQPVVIKDKKGKPVFVLIHNGTIYNYEDLAKKYIPDVDIKGLTDSQVMAGIFYRTGYDVLGEYLGGGVFVTVDYRQEKPIIRAFKGASKQTQYTTTEPEEERPFYYIKTDNSLVFSSIPFLLRAFYPKNCVFTLQPNKLCYYKNNDFYIEKEIDRSNCFQSKPYTSNYNYNSNYYGGGYYNKYDYDRKSTYALPNTRSANTTGSSNKSENNTAPIYNSAYLNWSDEKGMYILHGQPAHGKFNVDWYGRVHETASNETNSLGFYMGNILYKPELFDYLSDVAFRLNCTPVELVEGVPELVSYFSYNPIKDPDSELYANPNTFIESLDGREAVPYSGEIVLPFTIWRRIYKDGICISKEKLETLKESYRIFLLTCDIVNQDSLIDGVRYEYGDFDYDE